MIQLPQKLGAVARIRPLAMAERAIDLAGKAAKTAKARFVVVIDCTGIAWVERLNRDTVAADIAATFTRRSDPDWLEEQIEFAGRPFV